MVPSLRFLPRWWVIVTVLLGVLLSLGLIFWLALQATALVARRPAEAVTPARPKCDLAFPERGCPAVGQALLALRCKEVNSTLFELHLSHLFATRMAAARTAQWVEDEDDGDGDLLDDDDTLESLDEGSAPGADSLFAAQTQSAWRGERPRQRQRQQRQQRGAQRQGRHSRRAPDTTTTMVCYLLVTLLVASAVLAVGEVLRDWWASMAGKAQAAAMEEVVRPPPGMAAPPGSVGAALVAAVDASRRGQQLQQLQQLSRRCSLVDLTVSRHERRESMAAAHAQAHGTHANHPSHPNHANHPNHATGQAGIGSRPPPLSRRSSFPAAPPLGRGAAVCPSPGAGAAAGGGHLAAWESVEDP